MNYLTLCLIAKNEGAYLTEWVDYHILMGAEHFFIYDNESDVSIRETLAEYVKAGWVTVVDIAGQGRQLFAYNHCIRTYGPTSRWIGFIDTDEFLVPRAAATLSEFLETYEPYAGLAVSSLFFGSGNNRKKPAGGQIASYRMRTPDNFRSNRLVKSIVQPDKIHLPISPHLFMARGSDFMVNENFQRIDTQVFPHHSQHIQLNHYYTRSFEEIEEKLKRGRGDAGAAYQHSRFEGVNRAALEKDTRILETLQKCLPPETADPSVFRDTNPANTRLLELMHAAAWQKKPGRKPVTTELAANPDSEFSSYFEKTNRTSRLLKVRDWDGVLQAKSELIEMTAQSPVHYVDFASISMQKGDFPLAWQAIAQAWKIAPQSHVVLQVMAEYYLKIGDYDWLEKISQMLITANPQENTSYFPLAMSLIHKGEIEKGLELAINILPDLLDGSPIEQLRAGLLIKTIQPHLLARRETDTINRLYRAAIFIHPDDISLYITAVEMNLSLKKTRIAQEFLKEAIKHHPGNTEVQALEKLVRNRD